MAVKRIVPNIASDQLDEAESFYAEILDMEVAMNLGWIKTFAAVSNANPQVSVASEGGSGTPVPDLFVEVIISTKSCGVCVALAFPSHTGLRWNPGA